MYDDDSPPLSWAVSFSNQEEEEEVKKEAEAF